MTSCPSREQYERLLQGVLPDAEEQSLDSHLKSCAGCLRILEELTAVSPQALRDSGLLPLPRQAADNRAADSEGDATVLIKKLQQKVLPKLLPERTSSKKAGNLDSGELLPRVEGYRVFGLLGRGGMGVVYKAEQLGLGRIVALKMIRSGLGAGSRARFHTEVTAVARLQHPNIVQIFEIGDWRAGDGSPAVPYYSLEYVEGGSLADKLAGVPQPPAATAHLVELVARAVHFAHEQGIIHRDLKPANILLNAGGAPKIADFGLAKLLEGADSTSNTGEWIQGTPCYMAPEQANPTRAAGPVGAAVDVYALGAILYEMLTGRPPFRSQTPLETALQVLHTEPTAPRQFRLDVPRDLETICLKCLAKDPARRYPTALELAEDLRRYQAQEPIRARPVSRAERLWRWSRRNPLVASLVATLAVVLVAAFALVTWKWRAEVHAAAVALAEKQQADRARGEIERLTARSLVDLAINQGDHGNVDRAMLLLAKSLELANPSMSVPAPPVPAEPVRQARTGSGARQALGRGDPNLDRVIRLNLAAWRGRLFRRRALLPHDNWVWAVAYSPDGKWVATASRDTTARIWDTATGKPVGDPLRHKYPVWTVAFSPDSKTLLSGSGDEKSGMGEIRLWETTTGRPLENPLPAGERGPDIRFVTKLAFSPDGNTILVVGAGEVHVCNTKDLKPSCLVLSHPVGAIAAALSPDGKSVVTAGADGTARLWNAATGKPIGKPLDHNPTNESIPGRVCQVVTVAFSPDGEWLLTGTQIADAKTEDFVAGDVRLWQVKTGTMVGKSWPHAGPLKTVVFSPDGKRALTGAIALKDSKEAGKKSDPGGEARLWDVATGNLIYPPFKQKQPIWAVAFSKDGRTLLTGNRGGDVQFWQTATGTLLYQYENQLGNVNAVTFSPDGRTALSTRTYDQGSAMIWEVPPESGDVVPFVRARGIKAFAFAPEGGHLVTGNATGDVRWWDLAKKTSARLSPPHKDEVSAVAFSPDGAILASGGPGKNIHLWNPHSGKSLGLLRHQDGVLALAFSSDGKKLLSGAPRGQIVLWDLAARKPLEMPVAYLGWVQALAFHPDPKKILAGDSDGTVQIWDLALRRPVRELVRHQKAISAIAVSPNGKTIAIAAEDHVVSLWDADSERPLGPPLQHDGPVQTVVFSPDGSMLLTGSKDRTARIWDVATGLRIGPLLAHPGPVLSAFRPKSKQFATFCDDGLLRLWELPAPVAGDLEHIQRWAQGLTAKRLVDNDVLQDLDGRALIRSRQR